MAIRVTVEVACRVWLAERCSKLERGKLNKRRNGQVRKQTPIWLKIACALHVVYHR